MPVGTDGNSTGGLQQHAAALCVQSRHRALAEEKKVFLGQPEAVLRGKELGRLIVRRRTGHHVQRNSHAVTSARGHDLLEKDLKQRFVRERADSEHALGMIQSQPRSLSAGHKDGANVTRPKGFDPALAGLLRGHGILCGIQSEGRWRRAAIQQVAHVRPAIAAVKQPADQSKVDRLDLPRECLAIGRCEPVPERQ